MLTKIITENHVYKFLVHLHHIGSSACNSFPTTTKNNSYKFQMGLNPRLLGFIGAGLFALACLFYIICNALPSWYVTYVWMLRTVWIRSFKEPLSPVQSYPNLAVREFSSWKSYVLFCAINRVNTLQATKDTVGWIHGDPTTFLEKPVYIEFFVLNRSVCSRKQIWPNLFCELCLKY